MDTPDQFVIRFIAREPVYSHRFWGNIRPPVYPLLYKLCGSDDWFTSAAQLGLSAVAHFILAAICFHALGGRIRGFLGTLAVLAYALAHQVNVWTRVMHSESLSFSLTALFLSATILVLSELDRAEARRRRLIASGAALFVFALLLSLCRDNWNYLTPFLALFLLAPCVLPSTRARLGKDRFLARCGIAALLCLVFWTGQFSQRKGVRWEYCLMNIIFSRVLPDEAIRNRWRRNYGMPVNPGVLAYTNGHAHEQGRAIYSNKPFIEWLRRSGLRSYAIDVATHPVETAKTVFRETRVSVDNTLLRYLPRVPEKGFAPALSRGASSMIFGLRLRGPLGLAVALLLIAGACIANLRAGRHRPIAWMLLFMTAMLAVQTPLITLADSMEVARHFLAVSLTLRLLMFLGLVLAMDYAFHKVRGTRRATEPSLTGGVNPSGGPAE